jgi:4-amino-4-deoxy-L-arabinose transferase-like glycosyltransferase
MARSTGQEHSRSRTVAKWAGLVVVLALFCFPLFIGLGGWDLQSDEAIYSYAVDRILETGDWLTPRTLRFDTPFLEKPPLKLWLVAGAIRTGLLPHDEFGFRFMDAALASIAFVYVFLFGLRLAGPICGVVAVLVLFTLPSLVFDHGLRTNNMDAALVLAYSGGLFHFAAWVENIGRRRSSIHVAATVAYFTFGFMTKFVAVAFLPLVCVLSVCWRADAQLVRSQWRDWMIHLLVAVTVIIPWFVYQAIQAEQSIWQTMWQEQVYRRFTGVLDPRFIHPWHYYFSQLVMEVVAAESHWISMSGLVVLAAKAWRGNPWLARLLFLWFILPFGLLAVGTSKYFHYTYPFLPPLALGAGAAAAIVAGTLRRMFASGSATIASRFIPPLRRPLSMGGWTRGVLVTVAFLAVGLSLWTALEGRVQLEIGSIRLLRNSSTVRPLLVAAVLLWMSGHGRMVSHALAIAAVTVILPLDAYAVTTKRLSSVRHPMRSVRDCAVTIAETRPEIHVYLSSFFDLLNHTPYYYLRQVGPWIEHQEQLTNNEWDVRLYESNQPAFLILPRERYDLLRQQIILRELPVPRGLAVSENIVLATVGRLAECLDAAAASGGVSADNRE